ncbi:hypothetical protein BX600DRAFT_544498 [Xylariales sp. PMI_506]|nr:hypothetical protein BX600DRAFT_544498 [Xylariales sp. PMI_506]
MGSLLLASFAAVLASAYTIPPPTTAPNDTISDCTNWQVATSSDTCQTLADDGFLTLAQLYDYNPSLAASGCPIIVGDSYCIEEDFGIPPPTTTSSTQISTSTTTTGDGVSTPSPVQTGIVSNCDAFYLVKSGDSCSNIASTYGITLTEFYAWNPAVGSTCLSLEAAEYVCVGVIGLTVTTTSTSSTSNNGVSTPQPIQTGMVSSCDKFYLVASGDSCANIASSYGISLAQFYAWNPAVGTTCASLDADDYVCVGILGGTTVTTTATTRTPTNGITTPQPIQTGMVSNCDSFYLVQSGDTCTAIASKYGITLTQFYTWNPAVGTSCASLDLGDYVCVNIIGGTTLTTITTSSTPGNGISTPQPIQTGMVSNCDSFYLVQSGDTCSAIATKFGISLTSFYAWNPAVGSTCASLDLGDYICVNTVGGSTATSTTKATTTTSGNGVVTPTPTQTGMVTDCATFHLDAIPRVGCVLYTYHYENGQISADSSDLAYDSTYDVNKLLRFIPDPRVTSMFQLALTFDFEEPLYSAFVRLVDACHSGTLGEIQALDRELQSIAGISALCNRLLLDVLVAVSIEIHNYSLLGDLVLQSPPVPRVEMPALWLYREDAAVYIAKESLALLGTVIAKGWLLPEVQYARWVMSGVRRSTKERIKSTDESNAPGAIALFDALVTTGFLPFTYEPADESGKRGECWYFWGIGVESAPLATLRHVAKTMPILESVPAPHAHGLVTDAANRPGRVEVLQFLVYEQGLDMNNMSDIFVDDLGFPAIPPPGFSAPRYRHTPLHATVKNNCLENMKWLLEHGCKILRDGGGWTPYERAVRYKKFEMVEWLKRYYKERNLPLSYVDAEDS